MNNFITSGCSFTAGVIPLPHDTVDDWQDRGSVWPHFCFANMNPKNDSFLNLALSGGGNLASMLNLIYVLETNKDTITPNNTLVGFNITALHRHDIIADPDRDKNVNKNLCCIDTTGIVHPSDILGFGWITGTGYTNLNEKNDILSCLVIIQTIAYLELHKFDYFFMIMEESIYHKSPIWFKEFLDNKKSNWITFENILGMIEFSRKNNQLKADGHPTTPGHKMISEVVIDFVNKNYPKYFNA